jgi:hypothetical protein
VEAHATRRSSFGRRTYTVRYVNGNRSAQSPPTTLDHGTRG